MVGYAPMLVLVNPDWLPPVEDKVTVNKVTAVNLVVWDAYLGTVRIALDPESMMDWVQAL